jgi:hypothetical protein
MGGFEAAKVHQILKLPEDQWPVVYLAIGSTLDIPNEQLNGARPKLRIRYQDLFHLHGKSSIDPEQFLFH